MDSDIERRAGSEAGADPDAPDATPQAETEAGRRASGAKAAPSDDEAPRNEAGGGAREAAAAHEAKAGSASVSASPPEALPGDRASPQGKRGRASQGVGAKARQAGRGEGGTRALDDRTPELPAEGDATRGVAAPGEATFDVRAPGEAARGQAALDATGLVPAVSDQAGPGETGPDRAWLDPAVSNQAGPGETEPGQAALDAAAEAALAELSRDRDGPIVFDAFRRDCASHAVLRILANKWVVLVVSALAMGTLRHSELARKVEGATPKMLTQTLRELERDGLVERHVEPASPPRVSYSLTPLGRDLAGPLRRICRWSEIHAARILVSRAKAEGAVLGADSWRRIAGIK